MISKPRSTPSPLDQGTLDQLFLDCAELETKVASIRQAIDNLAPSVDSGLVTAEHLMNLAFRIENTEHGLIAIAHQIDDTATNLIHRRQRQTTLQWAYGARQAKEAPECTKN